MRRFLAVAAGLAAFIAVFGWYRPRCYARGRHEAQKQLLGGYRCVDCDKALNDLGEAIYVDDAGYVNPSRRTFERDSRRAH